MSEVLVDTFKGDDAKLVGCIEALLKLDRDGALVPNGLGGPNSHAWAMLAAAASRLRASAPSSLPAGVMTVREALRDCTCPRPMNSEPDDLTVGDCVDKGQCGCQNGVALKHAHSAAIADEPAVGNDADCKVCNDNPLICATVPTPHCDGVPEPSRTTAMTVDPVGYVSPRTIQALATAEGAGQVVACAGYDTTIPVYATPPSSGNADAVREAQGDLLSHLDSWRSIMKGVAEHSARCREADDAAYIQHEIKVLERVVAALSSAPVAGVDVVMIDRNELRRHVIAKHVRMASGGGTVPNGGSCKICRGEWGDGADENHALTCPLSRHHREGDAS